VLLECKVVIFYRLRMRKVPEKRMAPRPPHGPMGGPGPPHPHPPDARPEHIGDPAH
jgi:hypothetical protein